MAVSQAQEDWGRRLDAIDGARRAGWAKFYEKADYAAWLEERLGIMLRFYAVDLRYRNKSPAAFWWQVAELQINPEWAAARLLEDDMYQPGVLHEWAGKP